MELQDDGSYMQLDFIVGHCDHCDYPITDVNEVEQIVKNGEVWTEYECPKCGHLNLF